MVFIFGGGFGVFLVVVLLGFFLVGCGFFVGLVWFGVFPQDIRARAQLRCLWSLSGLWSSQKAVVWYMALQCSRRNPCNY